jgi:radical SAM protein with 4Fe4S-binding SPASM domain
MKKPVTHINNDILYTWDSVPEIKYRNWLKMSNPEILEDFSINGYPFSILIEPTNFCNLKCPGCPAGGFGLKREKRHMKLEEFKLIIDDMENYLLFIVLWDWGEPLLNPDLPEMVRYAHRRDIKTVTSTNCNCNNFHNESYMERLLKSGLSTLILAVDSANQESYEIYREKGNLDRVLMGIRKIVSIKTFNHLNTTEYSDADTMPKKPTYRRYEYLKGTYQRILVDFQCNIVSRMCSIHADGSVAPCCWWYNNDLLLSNCFKEGGLTKVWNSPAYSQLRRRIIEDRNTLLYCRKCSMNYKFSRTGWFYLTLDLTKSRTEQWKAIAKRYLELNLPPKTLQNLVITKKKLQSIFQKT